MFRLTIVTDAWEPQVNGVVRVLQQIIPIVESRHIEVSLIHPGQFFTLPMPLYPEIRLALFPRRGVRALLKKQAPDAVHIMTEGPLGWAARRVCRCNRWNFTTSYHTHFALYASIYLGLMARGFIAVLRRFHAPAAITMVATQGLKKDLELQAFKHLALWPLGVDAELFKRNPETSVSLPKPVFVLFGRLAPEKSPEEFLKLSLPGSKLVIGDGPMRGALEKKYGDTAIFTGYKVGKELVDWLSACDVAVFPSRTETFGLTIVEALACGIPAAAYDVMGPRDILTQGVDGYMDENLTRAAVQCLELSREDCRRTALKFSWERSAEAFVHSLVPARADGRLDL